MANISWGIKTRPQHTTWETMRSIWVATDQHPAYDHAWLFDHFAPITGDLDGPCYEGWTTLAALAACTTRVRLGLMVAGNTYRHPAVHAHMAATVDVISNGRLDFGIGAGWNEYEHSSMGIPLYQPGERIRRMGEACELTKRLFTQHLTDFDGQYYQMKDARCEPKPVQKPYPPFVIGGGGEKLTLRYVAEYADIWNCVSSDLETFRHKSAVLDEHCAAIGRDPGSITRSVQVLFEDESLAATVSQVQGLVNLGVTHVILMLAPHHDAAIVDRLAREVVANVSPKP